MSDPIYVGTDEKPRTSLIRVFELFVLGLITLAVVIVLSGCGLNPTDLEVEEFCTNMVTEFDVTVDENTGLVTETVPQPVDWSDPAVVEAFNKCMDDFS